MVTPLREREVAVDAVAGLLASTRTGRGGLLFVEGDAGLGKSSILQTAFELARPDLVVGVGRADSMESSLPFGVLDQALSAIGGPDLLTRADGSIGRPEQLYRLLRWLDGAEEGVVLALDDLHWADADSLELLSLLSRRVHARPVAIVATFRSWPAAARDLAADLVDSGVAQRVGLEPLTPEAAAAMLVDRSGTTISDVAATRAWDVCAGNPLLLEQVASAIRGGTIDAEVGVGSLPTDALLLSRFAGLPTTALRCVRAASVLGVRFNPHVAAEVAGLTGSDVDSAIEALSRSSVIEPAVHDDVRFVHPLFAQALYDDLPAALRSRLHGRSFETLLRQGYDAEAADHAIQAGLRDADVVAALERAGRSALAVGALGTAVAQLSAAIELVGDRVEPSLLLAQGAALSGSGDPVAAAETYRRVLSRADLEAETRAEALRLRGRALHATGEHAPAASCFSDAAELLLPTDPSAAAETLIDQAMSMHIVLGPRGTVPLARRAVELAPGTDGDLRLRAAAALGYLSVLAGDPAGLDAAAAAARAVGAHPRPGLADPAWSWGLVAVHAHAAKHLEQFDVAASGFRSARLVAEQLGASEALTMALVGEAEVAARTGRLADALELTDRASELTELVPLGATHNLVVRFFALLHLDRGADADECRRQLELMLGERDEGIVRIWCTHLQGITHLGLGRPDAAADAYLRAEQLSDALGIGEPCVVPWAGRAVIAHARSGRDADAARVLDRLDACTARLPCRYPAVAASFGRAELALQQADHRTAERHYLEGLALHDGAELLMERISTLLAYGDMLRRIGEPARARPVLSEALERAEAVGAPALARYAREGLSSTGGRRRRRSPDGHLTPQELRVARLVRAGSSRREIAERLTVSEATVRTHLQHIYAKLGIHSARELMVAEGGQLAGDDDPGGRPVATSSTGG